MQLHDEREHHPPSGSVAGRLVAGVLVRLGVQGEGRLLLHVRHIAGIGGVSGRGVGGGVVGGGGIGWRVGGVVFQWRLCVGWDGDGVNASAETTQGKVGQDSPGGDGEEREGHGGACGVHGDTSDVMSATPLTGQHAETHKPQEGPRP